MELRRRCEVCGTRLAVGLVEDNKLHCYCPKCGQCVTFTSKGTITKQEVEEFETPSKHYM